MACPEAIGAILERLRRGSTGAERNTARRLLFGQSAYKPAIRMRTLVTALNGPGFLGVAFSCFVPTGGGERLGPCAGVGDFA